jgi:hypothetical protein
VWSSDDAPFAHPVSCLLRLARNGKWCPPSGNFQTLEKMVRLVALLMLLTLLQLAEGFLPHASPRFLRPPCAVKHVVAAQPVDNVGGGGDGGDDGDGIQQWLQTNVLQGVALTPTTYSIMVVYFVQGALGLAALARTYFLKDQLGLAPAEQAALMGVTTLPWVIKPVYGFLTDGLPIFGLRRKPYLVIGGLLGSAAWASLATVVETPTQVDRCIYPCMYMLLSCSCERLRTRKGAGGCSVAAVVNPRRRWWRRRLPRSAWPCRMSSWTRSWSSARP